jgi:hypothetical protein
MADEEPAEWERSPKPLTFIYEVGGVELSLSMSLESARKIQGWSTSEAILYLGSEAPMLLKGLDSLLGEPE